jgi:hypothetical protein
MESSCSPRFVRRYHAPVAAVAARLRDGRVREVGPAEVEAEVMLPVGRGRRVPMRLLLFGGPGTLAELVPSGRVRSGRAYYRAGHRFLDDLSEGG